LSSPKAKHKNMSDRLDFIHSFCVLVIRFPPNIVKAVYVRFELFLKNQQGCTKIRIVSANALWYDNCVGVFLRMALMKYKE
jgi:hypothetical protein